MSQRAENQRCHDTLERIEAWIDGDLDPIEAVAVESHVERCASCQAARREAQEVVSELRSLPEFPVPERVLQTVVEEARPNVWDRLADALGGSIFRPLPALAALAAFVFAIFFVAPWRGTDGPEYSKQEVDRVAAETKLALAYVGSVARRVEMRVKERVLDDGVTGETVRGVNRSLKFIGEAAAAPAGLPATPLPHAKGS